MNHNLIGRITRESRVCVKQKQFRSFFAANAKEMGGAPEIGIPTGLPMLQHKSCLAQVMMQAMMSESSKSFVNDCTSRTRASPVVEEPKIDFAKFQFHTDPSLQHLPSAKLCTRLIRLGEA